MRNFNSHWLGLIGGVLLATAVPTTQAASAYVVGKITNTLVSHDGTHGGCMASITPNIKSELPACGNSWVTFSCSGSFTSPVRAYRMLDQAQLALSTNKRVRVYVTDTKKHNGYCFATRIDVVR